MLIEISNTIATKVLTHLKTILDLPWSRAMDLVGNIVSVLSGKFRGEWIYEVLEYESTLELKDRSGKLATFQKRKKMRYLQNNVIAYQDYAWGDGEILLNYRTNRGKPVDRYRSGYKTYTLLSLREVRNKGDVDELNIQWDLRQGFLTKDGYWSTDVSQVTRQMKINVIFPKTRPPVQIMLEENNRGKTEKLGREAMLQLSDGRWRVTWEINAPRLYEIYVLRWIW